MTKLPLAARFSGCCAPNAATVQVVGEADSGESAIAAIEKHRPDLVFLDVQMPGQGGFDVVRAVSSGRDGWSTVRFRKSSSSQRTINTRCAPSRCTLSTTC